MGRWHHSEVEWCPALVHPRWGPSFIPLANGETQTLFLGRRWLSGPNLPEGCFDICGNGPPLGHGNKAACQAGGEKYKMRSDSSVWYPVEFGDDGTIAPFKITPTFTLDLPAASEATKCQRSLAQLCSDARANVRDCDVCCGAHQSSLRAAGCTAHDIGSYCTLME
eukprot:COSAG01_NODE_3721_length_5764_cov_2.689673_5_plen_166_part_00